jgi:FKBP-type peptidyl-prolyl cis-trans isomerase 2
MTQAKVGDRVTVHYTGSLDDGTVFGHASEEEPLEFTIGQKNILPSFEKAVIGMNEGDSKTISIPPEDAFGEHRQELVFDVEKSAIPSDIELQQGAVLRVGSEAGDNFPVTVTNIGDETVTLDGNHPLAGQVLILDIKLIEVV